MDSCGTYYEDDETDLEYALGNSIGLALSESKYRKKRKVSYKDYCWQLDNACEDLSDSLNDDDSESDRSDIRELAKTVVAYLQDKVSLLKEPS